METWEAIRSRRNVRSFDDRPLPADHLNEILEAGRRAPSSQNWQPWDFIAVTERERLVKLSQTWQGAGHVAHSAATIALVASPPELERRRGTLDYDLGQATLSIIPPAAGPGAPWGWPAATPRSATRSWRARCSASQRISSVPT